MNTKLRRRIHHTRRGLGYGLLVLLILFAVCVGIAYQLLPLVQRHPEKIAAWLSERVGEPVRFSHASAEWTRRGPRFTLEDLHVGLGNEGLDIGRAQLQIAMYSGLLPGHPLTELRVRELALTLVQESDGRWHAVGLPGQGGTVDPFDRLERFGELQIEKARLAIRSPRLKRELLLPRVDVRLRVNGARLRVGATAWTNLASSPISAVLDLRRDTRSGLLWIGGEKLQLVEWAPMLAATEVVPRAGVADLGLWIELADQRIHEVTAKLDIVNLALQSSDSFLLSAGVLRPAQARFDRVTSSLRWSESGDTWRLHAPILNVTQGKQVAHLDGLRVQGGERFALEGEELDLSPLAALLSLSQRLPAPLRSFFAQSRPDAVLRHVLIRGQGHGQVHGSMLVSSLNVPPYAGHPGLSGISGPLQFDQHGGVMRLAATPVHFSWPVGLREPIDMRLNGTIGVWKQATGWTLGTGGLSLRGTDFAGKVRAEIGFQDDGSLPTLNLAADFDPTSLATAKKFWILHKMPPATVNWLNDALVEGGVENSRIAIGGDLTDWPFRHAQGALDARTHIKDVTLRFNPRWPAGQQFNGDVAFNSLGVVVDGSALLLDTRISRVSGGIADFHTPWLTLDMVANGSGENLRELMIASPLNDVYGEHLRAATISGNSEVTMSMKLPLGHEPGEKVIDGIVDLRNAKLADSRWNIDFTDVNGKTHFTHKGFATDNLKVRLDGQPGIFNLSTGSSVSEPGLAALVSLDGNFSAQSLIKRYDGLAWLKPSMNGVSAWKMTVRIPGTGANGKKSPAQLLMSSDLVGTSLSFPAPLVKAGSTALPLVLQAALPLSEGEINLRLQGLLRLRGTLRDSQPLTGAVQFGEGAIGVAPAQGLSIRGNVPLLDATGWIAASSSDSQSSASVHDVDVQARQLNLIDRAFADCHLQLDRSQNTTKIRIKGVAIEGDVTIPNELSRGVQANFSRFYMGSDLVSADPHSDKATLPATVEVSDPATLPPLHFLVADLRIGQAQYGHAELVTSPNAKGMRIEKFQTRSSTLNLDAAGEWARAGGGTRSNFTMNFTANNLGKMLDALGFTGMIQGGKTKASVVGYWPGSPGDFSLGNLTGTLKADVGEGHILDVEPGGSGRILGLLSLAEIPRRLTLNFSDFFAKGFAFNSARGDFVFTNGSAHTDNLTINGPAAEIHVSGSTGMHDETYDQRVEVLPKAGGLLPAIGLLVGGPAGAAVGAAAQAVLQKPLKQTTRVVYHITGPWKQPKVEITEKGPARASPVTADNTMKGSP